MRVRQMALGASSAIAALLVGSGAQALPAPSPVGIHAPARSSQGECLESISGLGPRTSGEIRSSTRQAIVARGRSVRSSFSTLDFWRRIDGCWTRDYSRAGRNGYAGWHRRPWDGSGLSPIGTYRLTDAGGRLPNPGTRLPYDHSPQWWGSGGFRMNNSAVQVFNYVVAINFNRYAGRSPRDLARPNARIPDGGIWFHVSGSGATRGCISLPQRDMIEAMRWLDPSMRPVMVMGPASWLRR